MGHQGQGGGEIMGNFNDLIPDLKEVLRDDTMHSLTKEQLAQIGTNVAEHFESKLRETSVTREVGKLWASDIGKPCVRQLYYEFTEPGAKEPLPYNAKVKFLYGNILEEVVIGLIRATGKHDVTDEQKRYEWQFGNWTVSGRQDVTVDGNVCDVKSASPQSYKEYTKYGVTPDNDKFGYRAQLSFYHILNGDTGVPHFLFIDKQNGHIEATPVIPYTVDEYSKLANDKITVLNEALNYDEAPPRIANAEVEATHGNKALGTVCSYCPFKNKCWPGLRTFLYSKGPVFLTEVNKVPPNITEIVND
jgi:hypothetical protein